MSTAVAAAAAVKQLEAERFSVSVPTKPSIAEHTCARCAQFPSRHVPAGKSSAAGVGALAICVHVPVQARQTHMELHFPRAVRPEWGFCSVA